MNPTPRSARLWILVALVLLSLGIPVSGSQSADKQWAWFSVVSLIDDWSVMTGKARVVLTGSSLVAELYGSRDIGLVITLKGTITNGRVQVVAVQHSTDAEPQRLTGKYKKTKWENAAGGRESMLLTDPEQPWGLTIGLTREIE